jgi:hypothetical protein
VCVCVYIYVNILQLFCHQSFLLKNQKAFLPDSVIFISITVTFMI